MTFTTKENEKITYTPALPQWVPPVEVGPCNASVCNCGKKDCRWRLRGKS